MKKKWVATIMLVIVVMVIILIAIPGSKEKKTENLTLQNDSNAIEKATEEIIIKNESPTIKNEPSVVEPSLKEQLSTHNTVEDCWIIFENKIYDITNYLSKHPGGKYIISRHCGKDTFENSFLSEHARRYADQLEQVTTLIGNYE